MQKNNDKLSGVLHEKRSAECYQLRRYLPAAELKDLVEQFWFVDWDLTRRAPHTQKNLPDPNFHLKIANGNGALIGPVSRMYSHTMQGKGQILGVKFNAGSLLNLLTPPLSQYVDATLEFPNPLPLNMTELVTKLHTADSDDQRVSFLTAALLPMVEPTTQEHSKLLKMLEWIKHHTEIVKVEDLAIRMEMSVRAVQRCFAKYLGLSPKPLIRKYRLHQALQALDGGTTTYSDLVYTLGYTRSVSSDQRL